MQTRTRATKLYAALDQLFPNARAIWNFVLMLFFLIALLLTRDPAPLLVAALGTAYFLNEWDQSSKETEKGGE